MDRTPTQTACTDAHSVSQHILNKMITFHRANTRGSRLHIFVSQKSCHPRVMSRSLPHLTMDHKHKLSHLPHLSFRRFHQHTQDLWRTIHIYPAKFHGRVADQHKSHLSHVELIERFITAGFRCCSRWLENAASDCVCFVARLLSSSCTPLSSMLKPVIWIVITTSSDCESCFVAARRLFLFFDLGHSCPVRRILTFIVNSGRDSSVCSGLENCHRCCAAPRILATSRNLVSAATLPERGSCGLFAAAVLPYEVLALQLAMLFHPLWLRSSHPMWVRSSCSFAVTVVDHPSRRPVPQASSFRRQRTSFPRSSLRLLIRDRSSCFLSRNVISLSSVRFPASPLWEYFKLEPRSPNSHSLRSVMLRFRQGIALIRQAVRSSKSSVRSFTC